MIRKLFCAALKIFILLLLCNGCEKPSDKSQGGNQEDQPSQSSGLIAQYDFVRVDDNIVTDSSKNGFDGVLQEGAEIKMDQTMGKVLSLNGEGAFFELPQNILDGIENYTISMFVNVKELSTWSRLFDFGSGTQKFIFLTLSASGGKIVWDTNDTTKVVSVNTGGIIVPINNWINVTCTYENGTSTLYLNGHPIAQKTGAHPDLSRLWNTSQNYIGNSQFDADPSIKADFADIRLYNRALSQDAVERIVNRKINAKIVALEDVSIEVKTGESVVLPKLITARTATGKTVQVMVFWDDIPEEELKQDGQFYITGKIGGSDITAKAKINVTSMSINDNYSINMHISAELNEDNSRDIITDFNVIRPDSKPSNVELRVELYQNEKMFDSVVMTKEVEGYDNVIRLTMKVNSEYADKFYDAKAYVSEINGNKKYAISTVEVKHIIPAGAGNEVSPLDVKIEMQSLYGLSQQTGLDYVLRLDPDRLIAPCYQAMGKASEAKGKRYGGWEAQQIAGHSLGHYLSALADFYASTGNSKAKARMEYVISELKNIQREDGYLGGIESQPFDMAFGGEVNAEAFGLNGYWVPWYSLHKIYAGLLDAYKMGGNQEALAIVKKMADWACNGSDNMSEEDFQKMLLCEHGGMGEVMAELYDITKDIKYLRMAKRFTHKNIIDPLSKRVDALQGLHANTQIPKIIGAAKIYELTGDEYYGNAAKFFFETVIRHRSFVIGGNSVGEHFGPSDAEPLAKDSCETCNTYNMMKLAEHMFLWEKNSEYADYYERAFYNHILASQDPDTGAKTYFVSTYPGHFKVYGTEENSFWCCVGTGMENPGRYNRFIYYIENNDLYINMFIPSTLACAEKGLKLSQKTQFPYADTSEIEILQSSGSVLNIKIRVPYWIDGELTATVGDKVYRTREKGYLNISRMWQKGDKIIINTPMKLHQYTSKESLNKISLMYGPVVLAAALGRESFPPEDIVADHLSLMSWEGIDVPRILTDKDDITQWIRPVDKQALTFEIDKGITSDNQTIPLKPFYDIHHERYTIYFDKSDGK